MFQYFLHFTQEKNGRQTSFFFSKVSFVAKQKEENDKYHPPLGRSLIIFSESHYRLMACFRLVLAGS